MSTAWTQALDAAAGALALGDTLAAIGEPGSGRATLAAQAQRRVHPRDRILSASPPGPKDLEAWLDLWTPELSKAHTGVMVRDVDTLPLRGAQQLREIIDRQRSRRGKEDGPLALALTAHNLGDIPSALASMVDTVVQVPPLRERPDDVPPLMAHAARRARGRDVAFTRSAERALRDFAWPGNVEQLTAVIRAAAIRTDTIDVQHLPPEVLSVSGHQLTRMETVERDEIVRALIRPGATAKDAADALGMSRATIYRKLSHYGLPMPTRSARE